MEKACNDSNAGLGRRTPLRAIVAVAVCLGASGAGSSNAAFQPQVLIPPGEAPLNLRFFTTPVKTDSTGNIITQQTTDPVKHIVGAESAGERGGLQRFTKIMFGARYDTGVPDTSTRIDPNNPIVTDRHQFWPHADQPSRS